MAFEVIRMGETIQDCESLSMLLNVNIEDPMLEDSICGLQSFILLKSITCRAGVWHREGIVTRLEYHLYFPTLPGDFTSLSRHSIRPENEIYYKYCTNINMICWTYYGRALTLFVWFSLVCFTQSSADIVQSLVLNPSPAALLLSPSLLFLFKNVQN